MVIRNQSLDVNPLKCKNYPKCHASLLSQIVLMTLRIFSAFEGVESFTKLKNICNKHKLLNTFPGLKTLAYASAFFFRPELNLFLKMHVLLLNPKFCPGQGRIGG